MYTPAALHRSEEPQSASATTHCPYCALQCGMHLHLQREAFHVQGAAAFPNQGQLCVKGWTAPATLTHPERLLTPLARQADGSFLALSWDEALTRIVRVLRETQQRYGPNAVGIFGGGSLTNEKAYLLGKFARVALGTSQIDYNGRFCMSSAAAASLMALGIDRGLPFPLEDLPHAEVILLVGSNPAETMPPLTQYFGAQRRNRGQLIVIDPRTSPTAQAAHVHLRLIPGTDAALANGLLHILIREGLIDLEYIQTRTQGFAQVRAIAATYWPERVESITGISVQQLEQTARLLGHAGSAMILTARGVEQQSQGVQNVLAFINLALARGLVGRPYSGYGCLTGQGNGQGGREHGQKSDQLPGYRRIDDPTARQYIAGIWGIREQDLPGPGTSAYEMLDAIGQEHGVHALFVAGSNLVVSVPHTLRIQEKLKQLDFLIVADIFLSETARIADIVLPVTQWAEEEGTMTNLEGRVLLRKPLIAAPAETRSEIEILCELAQRLGKGQYFSFAGATQVFQELRRASAGGPADYSGITYEKIAAHNGIFWPCPDEEHPGTPRLFQQDFPTPTGYARFHAVRHHPPAEEPDEEYPLYLTTGRILAQYQSGTQTRRVERLRQLQPEPYVEIHPTTARRYQLTHGKLAKLTTRRSSAVFRVKITRAIREDTLFVPFHWGGPLSINRLTNPALDPTSRMPEFKVCAVRVQAIADREECT